MLCFVYRCFGASYLMKNWLQCDKIVPSCCNVCLKELKTAIQCLGIKPKGHI